MPNRDYAVRPKSQKSGKVLLIILIIFLILLLSGLGLWWLKNTQTPITQPKTTMQKSAQRELPTPPKEVYSYIRDLETREVPVDKHSKFAQLTKEQEQQMKQKQEEEKRKLEEQANNVEKPTTPNEPVVTPPEKPAVVALTPEQVAQKAKEQKVAEEKRKQAELKNQQELAKKAEQEKQVQQTTQASQPAPKPEISVKDPVKKEKIAQPAKIVATAKPASEAPKSVGKYGLQCGAFKNKAQAENMQARLAMAGYNARISSSAEWNRVFVGPIGDRAAASSAQSNARSVAECLIVGM